jgi:hypothetical protein
LPKLANKQGSGIEVVRLARTALCTARGLGQLAKKRADEQARRGQVFNEK